MSKTKFIAWLIAVMCSIAVFQVLSSEALVYQVIHPTIPDTIAMLNMPGPIVIFCLAVLYVLVYFYLRPILRFIDEANAGKKPDAQFTSEVQDRASIFPYFMALLAYPFYMIGSSVATWYICWKLGWPYEFIRFGFLGGLISCLLATPVAIYGYGWQIRPIIDLSIKANPDLPPARRARPGITVAIKFVVTVLSLVIAITGYTLSVGYRQTNNLLENMQKMEQMVPAASQSSLARDPDRTFDARVKSFEYFHSQTGNLLLFYIAIMSAAVIISLILAIAAALDVTSPLWILKRMALQVQEGNYSKPLLIGNDELPELASAFNQMIDTIRSHIKSMEQVADNLKAGIRRIDETINTVVSVSEKQSNRATNQASSLQQTSVIAKEIALAAKEIEGRARTMDKFAESTLGSTQNGRQKLERSREEFAEITRQMEAIQRAMAELEVRFRETYSIVELIRDMAEKTEILSLNASIEAAAAGAGGRRFMVVAEETRNLSIKSADAVRQIKELISSIQQATLASMGVSEQGKARVIDGGRTIDSALETLKKIADFAQSTFSAVKEIENAAGQQSKASGQLAGSVAEIYGVSKEVENGANQINSAVTNIQRFAESLRQTVQEKGSA